MWHHNLCALAYLRDGGHPDDDDPDIEMTDMDQNSIDEFESLIEQIASKQDRVIFFYADPKKDKPVAD
jgi:hypothetical protein